MATREAGSDVASCSSSCKVAATEQAVAGIGTVVGSVEPLPWKVVEPLGGTMPGVGCCIILNLGFWYSGNGETERERNTNPR